MCRERNHRPNNSNCVQTQQSAPQRETGASHEKHIRKSSVNGLLSTSCSCLCHRLAIPFGLLADFSTRHYHLSWHSMSWTKQDIFVHGNHTCKVGMIVPCIWLLDCVHGRTGCNATVVMPDVGAGSDDMPGIVQPSCKKPRSDRPRPQHGCASPIPAGCNQATGWCLTGHALINFFEFFQNFLFSAQACIRP